MMIWNAFPADSEHICSETTIAFLITILICLVWSCLKSTDSCAMHHDDLKRFPRWFWAYLQWDNDSVPDHNFDLLGLSAFVHVSSSFRYSVYCILYLPNIRTVYWEEHPINYFFPSSSLSFARLSATVVHSYSITSFCPRIYGVILYTALVFNDPNPCVTVCLKDVSKAS